MQENKNHYRLRSPLIALLCSVIILINGCSGNDASPSKAMHKQQVHIVQTHLLKSQTSQQHFKVSANTLPSKEIKIANQIAGKITQLNVSTASIVKKGQLLIKLDDSLLQAELNKAQAQVKQAILNLKRLKNLEKSNLSSADEITKAQTAVDITTAEFNLQKSRYQQSKIHADFDGVISEQLIYVGDTVTAYSHLLTLIDTQQLKIIANVSAKQAVLIDTNEDITINCDGPNNDIPATISHIHPVIDTQNNQIQVEIEWQNKHNSVLVGQLCQVEFSTNKKQRLMITDAAIRHDTTGSYVYTVNNNKVKRLNINTGIQIKNKIEIISGLKENDEIVTAGFLNLSDGDTVKKRVYK